MEEAIIPMQIVVLAAGHGKRMNNSELPKVLVPLKGKPIIKYLLEAIKKSEVTNKPVIVVGQKADIVKQTLGPEYNYVFQAKQLGTGQAVACARDLLKDKAANVMVLYGDHPLITPQTIKRLAESHLKSEATITMATVRVDDFNGWRKPLYDFGRIIRDQIGKVVKIVEKKDAAQDELKITEVNPGYYCFQADWLWNNLPKLKNDNVQQEYYLTDLTALAVHQGQAINSLEIDAPEALGVNSPEQLKILENLICS
ncbi:MAG: NTP transferase domain-containing protein [Candidatus Kerfeldbacteria bacterium]|nr:NTP transferase domain-containing protein [Candidatus Kerfeldbacteria bacterium]